MQTVQHFMLLPEGVPEWVHLCPAGRFFGRDGRGPFTLKNPAAVIAASMAGGAKLPIDEMHATDTGGGIGNQARARGWIVAMESREDGIWGRVEWTPTGTELMTNREYRGISPVWPKTENGEVTQILRAGLTNAPNLVLAPLTNTQETTRMDVKKVRSALGLPDAADEAAILAAIAAGRAVVSTHALLAAALGQDAAVAPERLVVEMQAQKGALTKVTEMAATIVDLQTQITTLTAGDKKARAVAFVDAALAAKKPVNPIRDFLIDLHQQNPEQVEKMVNAMPAIGGDAPVVLHRQGPVGVPDELTDEEKTVVQKMGVDPAKFLETKKKRGMA